MDIFASALMWPMPLTHFIIRHPCIRFTAAPFSAIKAAAIVLPHTIIAL
jgi:hypothetical protein